MGYEASKGRLLACVAVGLLVVGFTAPALGGLISYTAEVEHYRLELTYSDVFGDPLPSSNGVLFFPDPTVFCAEATGANGYDDIDGYFRAVITSLDGTPINTIGLWEFGEYMLRGTGTVATEACVDVPIVVMVTEIAGSSLTTPVFQYPTMAFRRPGVEPPLPSKPSGDYDLVADRGTGVLWVGATEFSVGQATKAVVILDNILSVASEEGSRAKMLKKGFGIEIPVPEPSALAMMIAGLCALLAHRRR